MKKLLAMALALLMVAVLLPVTAMAEELTDYVTVSGIAGCENKKYASFAAAYAEIKPVVESLGLGQESATNEDFDALFTDCDSSGNATLTYTITGNVIYDEASCANLLTMGRKASHYSGERHLINFKFVGGSNDKTRDTLVVNSDITLPYEWWGEDIVTSISFENLTIKGSNVNGLFPYQPYFEGINFKVDNCKLEGIKIYNCSNVKGSYTITNNILDGTGAGTEAYAIHLQGHQTEPLTINISGNTISGYARGINIDQKTANATISNNTIKDLNGITKNGNTYGSAIQLTGGKDLTVINNTIDVNVANAIHFHNAMTTMPNSITISNNNIKAPYLLWNEANVPQNLITSAGNTLDITYPGEAMTKTEVINSETRIEGTAVNKPIVIIVPDDSTDTTTTTEKPANPATGANDFVGAAAALAAVSLLGMAAITRKK